MRKPRDVAVRLALAQLALMAAVVAAFVVHSIVNIHASDVINNHVEAILDDAVPSIGDLAEVRGQLRGMETTVQRAVRAANAASAGPAEEALATARRAMDTALARYMALPLSPGEGELRAEILDARAHIDDSMDATLDAVRADDTARAQASLTATERQVDRFDAAIARAVVFNLTQAERVGREMGAGRTTLDRRILLVDAVLVALAFGATALAAVTWRRAVAGLQTRASELDMFAGRVAHDVLSPLMAVAMGLSLSKRKLSGDAAAMATLERSGHALDRVRELVAGLLEFARAAAAPQVGQTVAVRAGIRAVLETAHDEAEAGQVELVFEPGPERDVACTAGCFTSLVQNLVRNAVRYMGDAPRRLVTVRVHDAGPFVRIEVEDTGPGVPEPIRRSIFEPFVRGTDVVAGAGLGLATVKRLAEGYGGRVGCHSKEGEGSLFWFELPRAPSAPADISERAGHPSAPAPVT